MKKYKRTLQEIINLFSSRVEITIRDTMDCYNKDMDIEKKLDLAMSNIHPSREKIVFTVKDNKLYCFDNVISLRRAGKKVFPTTNTIGTVIISPTKIIAHNDIKTILRYLFKKFQIKFLDFLNSNNYHPCMSFLNKPSIIKSVLIGKVEDEQTLYKEIMSKCFQLKNVDWKVFKDYIEHGGNVSILDIKDFTSDPEVSLTKLVSDSSNISLISDLIQNAIRLNQKVDLSWSEKRMQEEYKKQKTAIEVKEIENKSQTKIYDDTLSTENIYILNTEKEIFLEGKRRGRDTIYRYYYPAIKNHTYILFNMRTPEDCTFGIQYTEKGPTLDQIYGSVQTNTTIEVREFLKNNCSKIKKLLDFKRLDDEINDDLPF